MATAASIPASSFDPTSARVLAARIQESGLASPASFLATEYSARTPAAEALAVLATTGGETPLLTPYQLGLQALQNVPAAEPAAPAPPALQETRQATLAAATQDTAATTLPDAATPATGTPDPTQSALFQALLGSLATQVPAGTGASSPVPTEEASTLRVARTFAGEAARAFDGSGPPQARLREPGGVTQPGAAAALGALEGLAPDYGAGGAPTRNPARIGSLLDVSG